MKSEVPIEEQQDFYNRRWQGFKFANRLRLLRTTAILDALAATRLKEPRIVDLGCGAGWLTNILGVYGPTTGVDLSSKAVEEATERYPHANFVQADILDWKYPKEAFDVVVSQEMIEHVEAQEEYIEVAHGLLRSGGYLILTTPNADSFNAMSREEQIAWSNQPIEKWLTLNQLRNFLEKRFQLIRLTTIIPGYGYLGMYRVVNSGYLTGASRRLGFDRVLDKLRQALGYGLHLLAVGKKR